MLEITNEFFVSSICQISSIFYRNIEESDDKRLFHQGERRFGVFYNISGIFRNRFYLQIRDFLLPLCNFAII